MPSYLFNTINIIHLIIEFIDKLFGIIPNNKPITSPILPPHRIIHTTHAPPPKLPSQIIKNKKFYSPPKLPIPIITRTNLINLPLPILPPKRIIEQKSILTKTISIPKRILPIPMNNITNKKSQSSFNFYIPKIIPFKPLSQVIKNNSISNNTISNTSNNTPQSSNNTKNYNKTNLSQITINPNVSLSQTLTQGRKIIASKPKNNSSPTNNTSTNNTSKNNTSTNNTSKNNQKSNFQFSKIKLLPDISLSNIIHNRKISVR